MGCRAPAPSRADRRPRPDPAAWIDHSVGSDYRLVDRRHRELRPVRIGGRNDRGRVERRKEHLRGSQKSLVQPTLGHIWTLALGTPQNFVCIVVRSTCRSFTLKPIAWSWPST